MGKTSATGSLQLLTGVATSTIIMAVGTIIIGRLLTPDEFGLYGIALVPSTRALATSRQESRGSFDNYFSLFSFDLAAQKFCFNF